MKILMTAALAAATLACGSAFASGELAPGLEACLEKNGSTAGMQDCYFRAHAHQDKILNENYRAAMRACGDAPDPAACRAKLRDAERAWIRYRDAMADYIGHSSGASLRLVISAEFMASETAKQARYLDAALQ